jgi:hypothetical protein
MDSLLAAAIWRVRRAKALPVHSIHRQFDTAAALSKRLNLKAGLHLNFADFLS